MQTFLRFTPYIVFAFHIHPLHHSIVTTARKSRTPPRNKNRVCGWVSQQQRQKPPAQTQPAVKVFDVPRGDISTTEEAGAGGLGGDAVCAGAGGGGGVSATAAADAPAPPAAVCASSVELGLFFEPLRCCLRTQRRWLPNARVASTPCTNHMAMRPRDAALLSKKSTPQQAQALREIACSRV